LASIGIDLRRIKDTEIRPPWKRAACFVARPRDFDIDNRDIICVLLGFDKRGAAIEIDMQIVIMAGQDEIDRMRIHQGGAPCLVGVHDGDDEIGARRARAFGARKHRRDRRREGEIARARGALCVFIGRADERDLKAICLDQQSFLMIVRQRAVAIFKVRRENREMGLSHPLEINILAKIELMIARNENIEPHVVEEIDHMRTLVEARQQARRERIAGMDANKVAAFGARPGALRLHRGREARHAAAPILVLLDSVDIVDQKKGHPGGASGGSGTRSGDGNARACGQDRRQGLAAGELCHSCLIQ
jgi:hypothetical protein